MNQYKRERALEDYREDYYPELPSRLHSIWVADEFQLSFWKTQFKSFQLQLFKVSLTGNLFKSSDAFIPNDELNIYQSYISSRDYWNPNFKNEEEENRAEFLFQGKVKIIEKIGK